MVSAVAAFHQRDGGGADVAANGSAISGCGDNVARQSSGRSLAVRAGNCHYPPRKKLSGQFNFANHVFAESPCLHQRRRIGRHAGAYHNQILPSESALAVSSRLDCDAVIEQCRNLIFQLVLRLAVRNGNPRAFRL